MAAEKPIISLEVDQTQFDEFLAKWDKFQGEAKTSLDPFASAAASSREAASAADEMGAAVGGIARILSGSRMVGGQSFITQWAKKTREATRDWELQQKSIARSTRDMLGLNRSWINFKAIRKDALIAGGLAAGGVAAMVKGNTDVAKQNLEARSLGLTVGKAQAFESDYSPLGLQRSDLSNFANAKEDPTLWKPMVAAGLTVDQIRALDPDELAIAFARKAGVKYHEWEAQGMPAAQIAGSMGFNDLLSNGTLRAAGSWSPEQWQATHEKYLADSRSMGIDSATADKATAFKQKWSADLGKVANAFDAALVRASGGLGHFADAASDAAIKLIDKFGPIAGKVADQTATVIDDVSNVKTFASPKEGGPAYPHTIEGGLRKAGDWIRSKVPGIPDVTTGTTRSSTPFTSDPKRDETLRRLERKFNLQPGVLLNLERQESSYGKNPHMGSNDDAGPAGPFQFDRAAAARFGVTDRMDEAQSAGGAAQYMAYLLRRYKGDYAKSYAAYDGFSGLDADIAKYGDAWRDHLAEFGSPKAVAETQKYLRDMEAHANDFASKFASAKTDTAIKPDQQKLSENDFQIVDLSKEGKAKQDTTSDSDFGGVKQFMAKYFQDGGGAQFRAPDRNNRADPRPVRVNLDVKVFAPAGSSTNVTQGGIPQ